MKKTLLLPLLLAFSAIVLAGNAGENVVCSPNENVIQNATIVQLTTPLINHNDILFYKTAALEKAIAERFATKKERIAAPVVAPRGFSYEETVETGYMGIFEIGGSFGVGGKASNFPTSVGPFTHYDFNQNFFSLQIINGRQIDRRVFVGFGFGFDVSPTSVNQLIPSAELVANDQFLVPLFLDLRGFILKRRISPYIEGKLGYAWYLPSPIATGYTYTGGPTIGLSVGARAYVHRRIAIDLSLGYRFQNLITQLPVPTATGSYSQTAITFLNFINLMAGITF